MVFRGVFLIIILLVFSTSSYSIEESEIDCPVIPHELWVIIFEQLSAKELLQSTCLVSKNWYNLIFDTVSFKLKLSFVNFFKNRESIQKIQKIIALDLSNDNLVMCNRKRMLSFIKLNIPFLRVLSMRNCGLRSLPDGLAFLTQLTELDVSHNGNLATLEGCPENIEVLNIGFCAFDKVPECIAKFKNLKILKISCNSTVKNGIVEMINISSSCLKSLSRSLKSLYIVGCLISKETQKKLVSVFPELKLITESVVP